jgi:hypothetical protein
MSPWHVSDDDLRRYLGRTLDAPALWSTEAHLAGCRLCRSSLADLAGPDLIDAGWARIDAAIDAPVPGPVERLLTLTGVPDHTARLLAAIPALRLSWLAAVVVTLGLTAVIANLAEPLVFLAIAPLLPLAGVAASFGPGIDPTYEITVVAPVHSFRLLLLRCVAVLSANTALCGLATLAIPGHDLAAIGWFLPSLAVTVVALLLMPGLGPVRAAAIAGVVWAALVAVTAGVASGRSVLFTPAGQLLIAVVGAAAAVVVARRGHAFDTLITTWRL